MSDPLPIPDEASEKDRQRIEQVNRNIKIRRGYESLSDDHQRPKAFQILAERHHLQPSTVKAIVYCQR